MDVLIIDFTLHWVSTDLKWILSMCKWKGHYASQATNEKTKSEFLRENNVEEMPSIYLWIQLLCCCGANFSITSAGVFKNLVFEGDVPVEIFERVLGLKTGNT